MALSFAWRGNTSTVATSPVQNLPNMIESFSIVNKTNSSVSVNVYLISDSAQIAVAPNEIQLANNEMYEGTREIVLLATEQIKVQSSGSVDYDFTLNSLR